MDEFIRELEEDLQREKLRVWWGRYGTLVIGGCVAVVLGTALGVGWKHYQRSQAISQTSALLTALDAPASGQNLEALAGGRMDNTTAIASLRYAASLMEKGDKAKATAQYQRIADASGVDAGLRALARSHAMQASDAKQALPTDSKAPFYYTQAELHAWQAVQDKDMAQAQKRFASLRDAAEAPTPVRDRAGMIAAYLAADSTPAASPTKE